MPTSYSALFNPNDFLFVSLFLQGKSTLAISKLAAAFLRPRAAFHWAERADRSSDCCALKNARFPAGAADTRIYSVCMWPERFSMRV